MAVEQIISDDVILVMKIGTGIIAVLIGALATVYTKWIIGTIKGCNSSLQKEIGSVKDYAKETRDLANQSNTKLVDHIITYHTRKD